MKTQKKKSYYQDDLIIDYSLPNRADVYFLEDWEQNNRYDRTLKRLYTRVCLTKSDPMVEQFIGFEYKRHWIYVLSSQIELLAIDNERWKNIRNWVLSNIG